MLLCVCLNPAIDVTYQLGTSLVPGTSHRVSSISERAGGKTVNVARLLTSLAVPCTLLAPVGGQTGATLRAELEAAGVRTTLVDVDQPTRRTLVVADPLDATVFNEPGPLLTPAEWSGLLDRYRELLADAELVVLSGSLPPGVPVDAYRTLVELAAGQRVRAIVDAEGEVLRLALAAGPYLVKPNLAELATIVTASPSSSVPFNLPDVPFSPTDIAAAGRELISRGARNVVISCGSQGLVAITEAGCWHAVSQPVIGNPTGAGDALVAALAIGTARDQPWPDRLRAGAGMSAATVTEPVAGQLDPKTRDRLTASVVVNDLIGKPSGTEQR